MSGMKKTIKVNQLINSPENPRHAIGNSEEDTLQKLFKAVGVQYMLNLAEDIQKHGLLSNQQVVVVFSSEIQKYVVYEGNRRIAAIKLLLDPDSFSFLDSASVDKAKRIAQQGGIPSEVDCYVTDDKEAFFIMERLHSGEDRGRGTKQWTSREKEAFKVRQSHQKKVSYLIDHYCKQYFNDFDITTILPFTTIERIFNNREIKRKIGLDITNEQTFTCARIKLIIDTSRYVVQEATSSGLSVTRLFNKARTIEDKLLPWLDKNLRGKDMEGDTHSNNGSNNTKVVSAETTNSLGRNNDFLERNSRGGSNGRTCNAADDSNGSSNPSASTGSSRNLPYFFQGINFRELVPNDADSHGIAAVCREIQLFSDRKLVSDFPIASAFLARTVIEQAIIYYSKKHNIQGQNKLIWEDIKDIKKLSKIIDKFKSNLANYIADVTIRQYFLKLFGNYEDNIDPLNWVVHRPAEFRLDTKTLIELPRKGLLCIINFMISQKTDNVK